MVLSLYGKVLEAEARGLPRCATSSNLITREHWDHGSDGVGIGDFGKALKAGICLLLMIIDHVCHKAAVL